MPTLSQPIALALAAFFVAAPAIAIAADWHRYAVDELGIADVYIDRNSHIRLPNGNVQAWQKVELVPGDGMLYLTEVNCAERKYFIRRVSAVKMTLANLKLIAFAEEAPGAWMDFKPTDYDERTFEAWCGPTKKR